MDSFIHAKKNYYLGVHSPTNDTGPVGAKVFPISPMIETSKRKDWQSPYDHR
jgi:hypothetical protein